jgi:hypothetical protein
MPPLCGRLIGSVGGAMRRIWGGEGATGLGTDDTLMKDPRLSVPARGLAVHLLLLPESARPDLARLASRPGETPASIAGYLDELEAAGYLRRRIVHDDGHEIEEVTVLARPEPDGETRRDHGRVFRWPARPA